MREKTGLSESDGDNWRISAITEAKLLVVVRFRYGQAQNAYVVIPGWSNVIPSGSTSGPLSQLCLGRFYCTI